MSELLLHLIVQAVKPIVDASGRLEAVDAVRNTTTSTTTSTTTTMATSDPATTTVPVISLSTSTARMATRRDFSVQTAVRDSTSSEIEGVTFSLSLERVVIFFLVVLNVVTSLFVCVCVSFRLSHAKRVLKKPVNEGRTSGESYPPLLV